MAGILLSARARDDIGAVLPKDLAAELIAHRTAPPMTSAELAKAEIAFLSVDLIGNSSKAQLSPELSVFFDDLRRAPGLKWLHVCSAGTDRPIFIELLRKGVRLTHSAGANAVAVAHTALAGVLALGRGYPLALAAQRRKEWMPLRGDLSPRDLPGQRALVVGLGRIGGEIGRLLKQFGLHVTGISRSGKRVENFDEVKPQKDFHACLPSADWLILACPLTAETRGMVDAGALTALPRGACVVNVARGEVLVERDLVEALRSGHLGGAALDVFAAEPLPADSPLWAMQNVIVTPHSAGNSAGFDARVNGIFIENLGRWSRREALVNEATEES